MLRLPTSLGADRLAVHTVMRAGEEIAFGEPGVTDQERAASGRQTIAERSRELLSSNRKRAAEQLAAPTLADGEDVLRVWSPRNPVALRARMGDSPLEVWAEGDVLHVLWRGEGDVQLTGGIEPRLWPVNCADDLWEASLRIRNLREAVITISAWSPTADMPSPPAAALVWRGSHAPAMRPRVAGHLEGTIEEHVLGTCRAGAGRPVTVYRLPAARPSRPLVGCILADGESTRGFAEVLEPAIADGSVPPFVLVGVHSAARFRTPGLPGDRRAQEYLPGWNRYRFDAHLDFVIDDLIPWATTNAGAPRTTWLAAGFSNGRPGRSRPHSGDPTCLQASPRSALELCPIALEAGPGRRACDITWQPGF